MITLLQFALVLCVAATCVITAQAGINDTPKTDADVTKIMDVAKQWVSAKGEIKLQFCEVLKKHASWCDAFNNVRSVLMHNQ